MELRQITYFIAVAEELNFSRAALRLHMAQPPLSTQIHNLEKELGVELFDRSRRAISLTDAGKVFLEQAYNLRDLSEKTIKYTRMAGQGEVGLLTIGFVPFALFTYLPAILRAFHTSYPEVELIFHDAYSEHLANELRSHTVDVAFLSYFFNDQDLSYEYVTQEPLVVLLPQDHPLARHTSISLHELAKEPLIMLRHNMDVHLFDTIEQRSFDQTGYTLNIAQQASHPHTIVNLVAAGMGIALLYKSITKLAWPGIVYRDLRDPAISLELDVAWRNDERSPVVYAFLDCVREVVTTQEDIASSSI